MKESLIDFATEQQEQLTKIGSYLQQVRLAKGVSVAIAAKRTKIRRTLLMAIESGDLSCLPEPVYLQGLLQRYAQFLGLNGAAIAQQFPVDRDPQFWKKSPWQRFSFQFQLRPVHLYFLYIAMVMVTVRGLAQTVQSAALPKVSPNYPTVSQATPSAIAQPVKNVSNISSTSETTSQLSNPVVVDMQVKDDCWLKVMIDGKTAFEGSLNKGTQKQWVANNSVTIRAGNAGGVMISFNNQQAKPLGKPGEVEEVTYQANSDVQPKPPRS